MLVLHSRDKKPGTLRKQPQLLIIHALPKALAMYNIVLLLLLMLYLLVDGRNVALHGGWINSIVVNCAQLKLQLGRKAAALVLPAENNELPP